MPRQKLTPWPKLKPRFVNDTPENARALGIDSHKMTLFKGWLNRHVDKREEVFAALAEKGSEELYHQLDLWYEGLSKRDRAEVDTRLLGGVVVKKGTKKGDNAGDKSPR